MSPLILFGAMGSVGLLLVSLMNETFYSGLTDYIEEEADITNPLLARAKQRNAKQLAKNKN